MKSTSGVHYIALDHVRALAALLVFVWHFTHGRHGTPVPFEGTPIWGPLVLFDEGHVGVAVFMTLSGYLFAKLLDGKQIKYHLFLYNRILRLVPLLAVVMIINTIIAVVSRGDIRAAYWFVLSLPGGLIYPTLPNGGWSIATEFHFYLVLPLLLFLADKDIRLLFLIILSAIIFRVSAYYQDGEVQFLAYLTIFGRIDQFVLGIIGFHLAAHMKGRHLWAAAIFVVFISFYYWFDAGGGFYLTDGFPSGSPIWIVMPTIEGVTFASLIAWYDNSFRWRGGRFAAAVSKVGEYSYSIYLLHFFVVFEAARWVNAHLLDLSNFYVCFVVSLFAFLLFVPIGFLSMKFIEAPFLRLRKAYYLKLRPAP